MPVIFTLGGEKYTAKKLFYQMLFAATSAYFCVGIGLVFCRSPKFVLVANVIEEVEIAGH